MSHKVVVRAKNPRKMGFIQFGNYTGRDGKLVELVDPNGNVIDYWRMTRPVTTLNLDNEDDNRLHEFLKNHPLIKKGSATLEDITATENANAAHALESADAVVVASKMNMKEYRAFARLAGFGVSSNDDILKAKVIQMAFKTPTKFLDIYHDKDKDMRGFVLSAIEKGTFVFSNNVWKYGSTSIGLTKDSIIVWLKENIDIYALLKNDERELEKPATVGKKAPRPANEIKPVKMK